MENLLSAKLLSAINKQFVLSQIEEIRLRANCPIVISSSGKNFVLNGEDNGYFIATDYELNYCLSKATQNSLYAVNDQLKQMYIAYKGGIRIGVSGDIVQDGNKISTIKYINSINIRIPHQIKNFANVALNFIYNNGKINSTLIVSPPGAGKTTLLRDICRGLGSYSKIKNILLADERYEIACCVHGRPMLDVGVFTDIVSGGTKSYVFSQAIRSMKPDVIITDELASEQDILACQTAIESGVSVIASVHAKNQLELLNNNCINQMLQKGLFTRIVVLSSNVSGRYVGVYDNCLKCLYMPY